MSAAVDLPEIDVAADVEADGPIPGAFSMLSFDLAVVGHPELEFYSEMKPIRMTILRRR
jgi:hypothetical protein